MCVSALLPVLLRCDFALGSTIGYDSVWEEDENDTASSNESDTPVPRINVCSSFVSGWRQCRGAGHWADTEEEHPQKMGKRPTVPNMPHSSPMGSAPEEEPLAVSKWEAKSRKEQEEEKRKREETPLIIVGSPEMRGTFSKFFVYNVAVVKPVPEEYPQLASQDIPVFHRYSHFLFLRNHLCAMYPGVFIPSLPPKKAFGSKDPEFVKSRMDSLHRFMNRVARVDLLRESDAFQKFICCETDVFGKLKAGLEADLAEFDVTDAYQKKFTDIIYTYKAKIHDETPFQEMRKFLTSSKAKLQKVLSACTEAHSQFLGFASNTENISKYLEELRELEKDNPLRSPEDPLRVEIGASLTKWAAVNHDIASNLDKNLTALITHEIADVDCFLEMLDRRDAIHATYTAALQKVNKWNTTSVQTDQQRFSKDADIEAESKAKNLDQCVSAIILSQEFATQLEDRIASYNSSIQLMALSQVRFFDQAKNLWAFIAEMANES